MNAKGKLDREIPGEASASVCTHLSEREDDRRFNRLPVLGRGMVSDEGSMKDYWHGHATQPPKLGGECS